MPTALLHRLDTLTGPQPAEPMLPPTRATAPVAPLPSPQFALIDTVAGFEALEPEWNDLIARDRRTMHVFQGFAWNWHWVRNYIDPTGRRGPRLAIVTGRRNGRLVLLLPLVSARIAGLRQLTWMGDPVTQYGDAIAETGAVDPRDLASAIQFAAKTVRADLAYLRKVRADSIAAPAIEALGSKITGTEEAPFVRLDLEPDYPTYESHRPTKRRKNRARQMRRLQDRGSVEFASHGDSEMAAHLASYAVLMKRASLKAKGHVSPSLADPRFAKFFSDIAHGHGRSVGCKLMTIRSGGEMAAMQIVLDHGAARFLHVSVFAGKFEKCGAGALLLEQGIKECFDLKLGTFDLLAPKHEYKLDFADGTIAVHDHAIALSRAGKIYVGGLLGFRQRLKRAIESMPVPARRAVDGALAMVRRLR